MITLTSVVGSARSALFGATLVALFLSGACGAPIPEEDPVFSNWVIANQHEGSGFQFPEELHGFVWRYEQPYDAQGLDTSQQYEAPSGVVLTVYVYPANGRWEGSPEQVAAAEYSEAVTALTRYHQNLVVSGEGSYELLQPDRFSVGYFLDALGDREWHGEVRRLRTGLWLFRHGDWFVKFRMSCLSEIGGSAIESAEAFMRDLIWPAVPDPNAI